MKASIYIATSLDGFIARENGALDWLPGSGGEDSAESSSEDFGFKTFMNSVDVLVMGRNTYEFVLAFDQWLYGDKRVIVLSNTLSEISAKLPKTVELNSGPPLEIYRELESTGANHVYIDGGKTIQGFLAAGLINDMIITRTPILIGRGIPLFGALARDKKLRHMETQSFENGFVQSKYEVLD